MTTVTNNSLYLEKPVPETKEKIKEQLLFGSGEKLTEKLDKDKTYKEKMLNETI